MPTFDIDCMEARQGDCQKVERYGRNAVAQIVTFVLWPPMVVRDVARVQ